MGGFGRKVARCQRETRKLEPRKSVEASSGGLLTVSVQETFFQKTTLIVVKMVAKF
jgi:hypothetical protein